MSISLFAPRSFIGSYSDGSGSEMQMAMFFLARGAPPPLLFAASLPAEEGRPALRTTPSGGGVPMVRGDSRGLHRALPEDKRVQRGLSSASPARSSSTCSTGRQDSAALARPVRGRVERTTLPDIGPSPEDLLPPDEAAPIALFISSGICVPRLDRNFSFPRQQFDAHAERRRSLPWLQGRP